MAPNLTREHALELRRWVAQNLKVLSAHKVSYATAAELATQRLGFSVTRTLMLHLPPEVRGKWHGAENEGQRNAFCTRYRMRMRILELRLMSRWIAHTTTEAYQGDPIMAANVLQWAADVCRRSAGMNEPIYR